MNTESAAESLSTVLDEGPTASPEGGGAPPIADKPTSIQDDLQSVFNEAAEADEKAKEAKPEPKEEADAKAKPEPVEKAVEKEAKEPKEDVPAGKKEAEPKEEVAPAPKAEKGKRDILEAPEKFLPTAKEKWINVPHEVRSEVHRAIQEAATVSDEFKAKSERYDSLREFDELAHSNGRDLRESLQKMSHIENMLQQNPIAGLNAILMEIGPRKADGQPFSMFEVAQHIAQAGQEGYQQMVRQPQAQQDSGQGSQIEALQAKIQSMEAQMVVRPIIEQFRAANPRYDELTKPIAFFLNSDMVPRNLSPEERLAAAYDMAVRVNPTSRVEPLQAQDGSGSERHVGDASGGPAKSIKSSLGTVDENPGDMAASGESHRDSLLKELRKMNLT